MSAARGTLLNMECPEPGQFHGFTLFQCMNDDVQNSVDRPDRVIHCESAGGQAVLQHVFVHVVLCHTSFFPYAGYHLLTVFFSCFPGTKTMDL